MTAKRPRCPVTYTLHHGDCLEVMAEMEAGSVDAVVCDPPYGLEFMGKEWDRLDGGLPQEQVWKGRRGKGGSSVERDPSTAGGRHAASFGGKQQGFKRCRKCGKRQFSGSPCTCDEPDFVTEYAQRAPSASIRMQRWHEAWAIEAYRVLKPSHYLLAFGGTRTWHRLACALEDAGFEIRDTLMWLYGSGFPKGKACLKPAWEPVILARKPGPMRELGIEECRVGTEPVVSTKGLGDNWRMNDDGWKGIGNKPEPTVASGRWPANLVLDEEAGRELDGAVGERPAGVAVRSRSGGKTFGTDRDKPPMDDMTYSDSGGPSRFFYCAKASRSERNAGLEGMEERAADPMAGHAARRQADDGEAWCESQGRKLVRAANHHPTVKPVALMSWLVRLVARPGDVVLDPFTGSGTTGVACVEEGRDFIGIEREAEYVEIARRRIDAAAAQLRMDVTA